MVLLPMLVFKILRVPGETPGERKRNELGMRESEKQSPGEEESSFNFGKKRTLCGLCQKFSPRARPETAKLRRKIIFSLLVRPFSNLISRPERTEGGSRPLGRCFQGPRELATQKLTAGVTHTTPLSVLNEAISLAEIPFPFSLSPLCSTLLR